MHGSLCRHLAAISTIAVLSLLFPAGGRADDGSAAKKVVKLVVDYGDGVEKHFTALAWREGMTVMDAMAAAQQHRRGIKFRYRGKGATAFLTKIDDLENEGRGRNWVYRVNGKLADRGFALYRVKPADAILWKFGKYR